MIEGPPPGNVRPLARLGPGGQGRIARLLLAGGERQAPGSPLRPGAFVQVLEASRKWLHVRIESREYPVPRHVAERVLVTVDKGEGTAAGEVYAVVLSRPDRTSWRVRVVARATGTVARSEMFQVEADARSRAEELRGDLGRLGAAAFRGRHGLP